MSIPDIVNQVFVFLNACIPFTIKAHAVPLMFREISRSTEGRHSTSIHVKA